MASLFRIQGNTVPLVTHRVERAIARVSHHHIVDDDAVVQMEGRERSDGRAGRGAETNVSHVVGRDGVRCGLRPAAAAAAAAHADRVVARLHRHTSEYTSARLGV